MREGCRRQGSASPQRLRRWSIVASSCGMAPATPTAPLPVRRWRRSSVTIFYGTTEQAGKRGQDRSNRRSEWSGVQTGRPLRAPAAKRQPRHQRRPGRLQDASRMGRYRPRQRTGPATRSPARVCRQRGQPRRPRRVCLRPQSRQAGHDIRKARHRHRHTRQNAKGRKSPPRSGTAVGYPGLSGAARGPASIHSASPSLPRSAGILWNYGRGADRMRFPRHGEWGIRR
jgi:hypothetical protein